MSLVDREEIAVGLARGESYRVIGARIGRPASTISREVRPNGPRKRYRALRAQALAEERAQRPKTAKLAGSEELRAWVQRHLEMKWSPEQISALLKLEFPDRPEMRVSPETIYQSIYVQGRGALRRELARSLRTGRALRKPRRKDGERRGKIPGMVNISERPAEAADRAVPGHWEGDLLIGARGTSASAWGGFSTGQGRQRAGRGAWRRIGPARCRLPCQECPGAVGGGAGRPISTRGAAAVW